MKTSNLLFGKTDNGTTDETGLFLFFDGAV
jgi:hypothetical protein